jgi:hypothetical protein
MGHLETSSLTFLHLNCVLPWQPIREESIVCSSTLITGEMTDHIQSHIQLYSFESNQDES